MAAIIASCGPLGIVANFGLLFAAAAALFVAARPVRQQRKEDSVGLLVVGLSLAAATLWCQDSLHPISVEGNTVTFKPWIDGFYHAVHLRIFGATRTAADWAIRRGLRLGGIGLMLSSRPVGRFESYVTSGADALY